MAKFSKHSQLQWKRAGRCVRSRVVYRMPKMPRSKDPLPPEVEYRLRCVRHAFATSVRTAAVLFERKASRRQSYLAVPIFVERVFEITPERSPVAAFKVAGTVSVAVMCLTSTLPARSTVGAVASFANSLMHMELDRELLAQVIGVGRIISDVRVYSESANPSSDYEVVTKFTRALFADCVSDRINILRAAIHLRHR